MPGTPTARYGITPSAGSDTINSGPATEAAAYALIDSLLAPWSSGLLASRPAAGKAGRRYRATDVGQFGVEYVDTGSAWIIAPGIVKLAEVTRASTGLIAFSSIPGGFSHLRLVGSVRSSRAGQASTGARLSINGNTATLYEHNWSSGTGSGEPFMFAGTIPAATANANAFAAVEYTFPGYAATGKWRTMLGRAAGTGGAGLATDIGTSQWEAANAITSITLDDDVSGGLAVGSVLTLYGLA
jgi:hypothetical protein